jgi:hypothetical protein
VALTRKYKGSTLAEVMVALALTSFCATLGVMIYINIQKSTLPFIKIKASELANKYLTQAIQKKDFFDNETKEEEYVIKKTVVRNEVYNGCRNLTITVYDVNKKKLAQLQTVYYAE